MVDPHLAFGEAANFPVIEALASMSVADCRRGRVDGGEKRALTAGLDRAPRVLHSCVDQYLLPHAGHSFGSIDAQGRLPRCRPPGNFPVCSLRVSNILTVSVLCFGVT